METIGIFHLSPHWPMSHVTMVTPLWAPRCFGWLKGHRWQVKEVLIDTWPLWWCFVKNLNKPLRCLHYKNSSTYTSAHTNAHSSNQCHFQLGKVVNERVRSRPKLHEQFHQINELLWIDTTQIKLSWLLYCKCWCRSRSRLRIGFLGC